MQSRRTLANAIRALSMDAVQKANSGHPGMPMGMADIAEVLWNDFLRHNPRNPNWMNRDRFILSNGHGSMLHYSLLHLTGYDLSIEDLKQFRQLHSKTPGHPEFGITPGIETTTGPLGQGFGNAVGMALAEQLLAAEFNTETDKLIDHYTYCFVGDGCLMEGISHEVGSLAGTLGLGKLIIFWDNNGISIDGKVADWFLDDTAKRFQSYHWHVIPDVDGHDSNQIKQAILAAQQETKKPTLICCKTVIGYGAPNLEGTEKTHGAALGEVEVLAARQKLAWEYPPFEIPAEIYKAWNAVSKGALFEREWQQKFEQYAARLPERALELNRRIAGKLPSDFHEKLHTYIHETQQKFDQKYEHNSLQKSETVATRKASQKTLEILVPMLPELFGGSADLSESNLTHTKFSKAIKPHHFLGNYLYYGVREFGMSAMMNGMALYKGFIPYGGTFLTFLDYARNAVRMAALMKQRVIFVYTHDSIGLGEDGPTHQPVEHLCMLRATPNMSLWRPCDNTETAVAWQMALLREDGPTSLALTRQAIPHQKRTKAQVDLISKGGYILFDSSFNENEDERSGANFDANSDPNFDPNPDAIIIATGSEVSLAMEAAQKVIESDSNICIRVVSMPSFDVFESQTKEYQESVLPNRIKARVAVEAAATLDWYKWVGLEGVVVGIDRFGESASGAKVFESLNITVESVIKAVKEVLSKH